MVRVGIAAVLVIALMPMAWAQDNGTLTYSGETPQTGDSVASIPNFSPHANVWDYCYTLTTSKIKDATFYIDVPFQPTSITSSGSGEWNQGTWANGRITWTKGPANVATTVYLQFSTATPLHIWPPRPANPGTGTGLHWATTGNLTITSSPTQLYTNPEPGGFALGAIVLGMAGGLWRRRPRKKPSASGPPTEL